VTIGLVEIYHLLKSYDYLCQNNKNMDISRSKNLSNYGWLNAAPMPTHGYLAEPIRQILLDIHARRVLDLGCGNGALAHWLQNYGFDVTGCDADPEGIQIATRGGAGAKFEQVSIYDDPPVCLIERGFDAVVSTEVVEHLFSPRALPQFASSVLKAGGYLIVTTPYHGYLKNLMIALTGKWDSHHTPLWDGGHIKFWSRRSLSSLLNQNGFEIIKFRGAGRISGFWKSMILVGRLR